TMITSAVMECVGACVRRRHDRIARHHSGFVQQEDKMAIQMNKNGTINVHDAIAIANLGRSVKGAVYLPNRVGYEQGRRVWNGLIDKRPALIVRPADPSDVAHAV